MRFHEEQMVIQGMPGAPIEDLSFSNMKFVCSGGGVVDKKKILDNKKMQEGDVIIAIPSTGVHSNGFSLVRKIFDVEKADLKTPIQALGGKSLGETLLTPTKIYVKAIMSLLEKKINVRAI